MRSTTAALRVLNAANAVPRQTRPAGVRDPRLVYNSSLLARPRLTPARVCPCFAHIRLASSSSKDSSPNESDRASSPSPSSSSSSSTSTSSSSSSKHTSAPLSSSTSSSSIEDWEENPNFNIEKFSELPHTNFGVNQHMIINDEFKEVLRQILWQFRAPIRYAFAYGSGVFPQSAPDGRVASEAEIKAIHPKAPLPVQRAQDGSPKMIDFIFGVTFTQHWHSLNLAQHRDHYSALGSLGSGAVSYVQDNWGAGVYFNPYVVVNGILVKYGVVNLDTLCTDLSEWQTLYLAGRLHKPVKILRDDARVRLANQINLLSALRTALLLLPPKFTERELYSTIAAISYLGDPRMSLPTENPQKVANIVAHNMTNFRRLYAPLIETLPNVQFIDSRCSQTDWLDTDADLQLAQDMDPVRRGNMVRRLPKAFRERLYFQYQKKFAIPRGEFNRMMEQTRDEDDAASGGGFRRQQATAFERRIVQDNDPAALRTHVRHVIKQTINWPSTSQSLKGVLTSGVGRSMRYMGEKMDKYRQGKKKTDSDKAKPAAVTAPADQKKDGVATDSPADSPTAEANASTGKDAKDAKDAEKKA
ncbi:Mitochondrial translocator assembly and maintenance protein 41 [Sporothrix bragantina]|uniref:Phosphatidate cytidylyltransferase, mitochondrial n=1 Tax=Sporothrix bragantina TaxID=671064 RepID=A0ABP0B5H4_9PEZI